MVIRAVGGGSNGVASEAEGRTITQYSLVRVLKQRPRVRAESFFILSFAVLKPLGRLGKKEK